MISLRLVSRCFVVALAAQLLLWPCGRLSAQPADHGISQQQAEVSLREVAAEFISQQKQGATNDYSTPRVRLYNLVRVYNRDIGWIFVAEFDGALVPIKWMPGEKQKFYHGIIKIAADKNGMPQAPVINEGQGLWESEAKVSDLYNDLREDVGPMSDWLGNPMAPPPPNPTANTPPQAPNVASPGPQLTPPVNPPPTPPSNSSGGGNDPIKAQYAEIAEWKKKCDDPTNPNRPKDCEKYYELQRKLLGQLGNTQPKK